MNFGQKSAIVSGSTASFIVFLVLCIYAQNFFATNPPPDTTSIGAILLLVWFLSLSIPLGAFYVAVKQSRFAFLALSIGVLMIVVIFGFLGLMTMIWSVSGGLFLLSPAVLSLPALFISMAERMETSRQQQK
jgi:hypothetical protein